MKVSSYAPGRVNVIGDHTDYTGGWVLPMAIQMGTTVTVETGGDTVRLVSDSAGGEAVVPVDIVDVDGVEPAWARYVAAVVAEVRPARGATGTVATTLPVGAGLSSSAALEVAVALAVGFDGDGRALAELCQRAEQRASGVPCGVMDQLAATSGVAGSLLLIDCRSLAVTAVPLPGDAAFVGIHSGVPRTLAGSAYADRRRECEAAEAIVGPLRDATVGDLEAIGDGTIRRRAAHVVNENARVLAFVDALGRGDLASAGALMGESHRSLRDDFEVSVPAVDELVMALAGDDGVHGARMTGGGFGGVVVALCDDAAAGGVVDRFGGWRLRPSAAASVTMSA